VKFAGIVADGGVKMLHIFNGLNAERMQNMGILQNFAIKKSTKIVVRIILQYTSLYFRNGIEDGDDFKFKMLNSLQSYAENAPLFNLICPDYDRSDFNDWKDLFSFIVVNSVFADLSYDPFIVTREHKKLIIECAFKELRPWAEKVISLRGDFTLSS